MKKKKKVLLFQDVGIRLRELRGNKPQRKMADELGVPLRTYCRYESGERPPPLPLSIKIARLYDTTIDWIMGGIPVEDGDQSLEANYRFRLVGQLVGHLEASLGREQLWLEHQGNARTESQTEAFLAWKDFVGWLREYCEQEETVPSILRISAEAKNLPLLLIMDWLREYWAEASDEQKTWLQVYFGKCFPGFLEWLEKRHGVQVSKDPP